MKVHKANVNIASTQISEQIVSNLKPPLFSPLLPKTPNGTTFFLKKILFPLLIISCFSAFCKWNHIISYLLFCALFVFWLSIIPVTHPYCCLQLQFIHSHCYVVLHSVNIPQFIHSVVDGHLGDLQLLTVTYCAAKKKSNMYLFLNVFSVMSFRLSILLEVEMMPHRMHVHIQLWQVLLVSLPTGHVFVNHWYFLSFFFILSCLYISSLQSCLQFSLPFITYSQDTQSLNTAMWSGTLSPNRETQM